jgi:transcriptional regulator NrdR family protein
VLCPKCHQDNLLVLVTRRNPKNNTVWRRRKCKNCSTLLFSVETLHDNPPLGIWNNPLKKRGEKKKAPLSLPPLFHPTKETNDY